MLRAEKVNLVAGSTVVYAVKRTVRNLENDVSMTTTLRDPKGRLLLAYASGQRPEVWDSDMLPGLTLSLDQAPPLCQQRGFKVQQLRIHLRSGTDDCAVDCYAHRCCSLGGDTLEVRADSAVRYQDRVGPQQDVVNIMIRRQGLISPVP
jgi:hypothetical protein